MLPWKSSANASFLILTTAQSLVYPSGPSEETPMGSAYKTCPMQRLSGIGIYWVTWLWRRFSCLMVSFPISTFCPAALIPAAILPFVSTVPPSSRACSPWALRSSALMPCWRFPTSVWIRLIPSWYASYPRAMISSWCLSAAFTDKPLLSGNIGGGRATWAAVRARVRRRRRG